MLASFVFEAKAQRPVYAKMSPLVREACMMAQSRDNAVSAKGRAPIKSQSITAFVKTSQPMSSLEHTDCKILAQVGNLYIVSMPISRIGNLSRLPSVQRIEAGHGNKTTMDTTRVIVGANAANEGINLPQSFTGKGVVVGVEDIGFDLTHPTFWSADMSRYRIKAMWDQLSIDTIGNRLPVGRDYRDSLSLLTIAHPRDGLIQTHGTHTAGIAAGSGSEGIPPANLSDGIKELKYAGIAPDADICLVCNATSDDSELIDSTDYYKYTYALDALGFKYIFDYADSVGKPCVINFSEGSQEDFHGDDILYYEMLDSLSGPGHIIVSSAGNEGGKVNYARKPKAITKADINITSQWHEKTINLTTRATGNYTISIKDGKKVLFSLPIDSLLQDSDSTITRTFIADDTPYTVMATAYEDCYDNERTVADWLISSPNFINPKVFTLQIAGNNDVEVYAGAASLSKTGDSNGIIVDNSHSVLSPSSAPSVICVGMNGYRKEFTNYLGKVMDFGGSTNGEININSSVGPTFDGRIKPDVVAPGQNIVSAYSSFYIENNPNANDINSDVRHFQYNGRTYAWNSNMGTSMSSPVVAGVIALWLQANPRLTPQDCMNIIAQTSTHTDDSMSYPNNVYGFGQIDAAAGLKLILDRSTGIRSIFIYDNDNRIYTLDGRYAGTDLSTLPKGLYIKSGKKILKRL